jgi:hypothetical protein
MAEELNEALLEGVHVDKWSPGSWANAPGDDEEWQPDVEPPHITDYAAFKKHKHYGKYFKPYRYRPFPAWMYHATLEPKEVKSREEVVALGPEWSPSPPNVKRIDMTGKALQGKSETQRLGEVMAAAMTQKQQGSNGFDPTAIAAVVAAVMAALGKTEPAQASPAQEPAASEGELFAGGAQTSDADVERAALIELAEKDGVKIDKRWSNDRIKKELGLD